MTIELIQVLLLMTALFMVFLFVRAYFWKGVCAVCAAVSVSWVLMLAALWSGVVIDPIIIALLLGGSIVGGMYALRAVVPETYKVFTLPFLLTGVWGGYHLLTFGTEVTLVGVSSLALLWAAFGVIVLARRVPTVGRVLTSLLACCRDW